MDAGRPSVGAHAYSIVEGTFDPDNHGHMSLFAGSLTKLGRLTRWK